MLIVQEQDKIMPRTKQVVHMGYSETQKGNLLYNLTDKKFFFHRDVAFGEDVFPY